MICAAALIALGGSVLPVLAQAQDEALRTWRRKRPEVARVDVVGNRALSAGRIRAVMEIHAPGFWAQLGLAHRSHLLVGAEYRDREAIRLAYRRQGFWEAAAQISAAPDESGAAIVTVTINEGPCYYWGGVRLDGDSPTLVARGQRELRVLARGAPADSLTMALVADRVRALCADRGHPRAVMSVALHPRADSIDAELHLTAADSVVLGELTIRGAEKTNERLVGREIAWEPGAAFSQRRLAWRQQDVYASGLFSFVHLEPTGFDSAGPGQPKRANYQLRVVERDPSYVEFRTGAGQDPERDLTWDYAVEWGSRNWMGSGRQWSLSAQSGFVIVTDWRVLHHRFAARYTEPWVFGVRLPTTLTLAYQPGVRAATQDFKVETYSGELNVTRRVGRTARWWSSLIYERVTIYGIPADQYQTFLEQQGISVRRRWTVAAERDTRPNVFIPTSGARTRVDGEYVGGVLGGADDFYKLDISWARYQIVSAPTVLASRFRLAWANTHSGGTLIPTLDRFYLGGANSIRGYAENTIGPVDDSTGAPIGGRVVTMANLELRTPAVSKLWFTLFLDAGNNFADFRRVALKDMLVSLGIGWQYIAPVGPIRLDYARRVVHPRYPKSDRLHLSILFSF
ncbi:MAG: BamA/TamA family outer membrane protein [Candidatus Zixiibacteriota bacterium]